MAYNLNDYVTVAERLSQASALITQVISEPPAMLTDSMGFIRVTVSLSDGRTATATASFRLDLQGKSAQATSPIEDCETSAVGRALAFLGYSSSKSIASREEVAEAQWRAEVAQSRASYTPATNGNVPATPSDAEQRFYARYASVIGGQEWASVQRYLPTRAPRPKTVEGWIAAAEAVRAKANESAPVHEDTTERGQP